MHTFLTKGLAETAALWSDVEQGYAWVHRAAHLLCAYRSSPRRRTIPIQKHSPLTGCSLPPQGVCISASYRVALWVRWLLTCLQWLCEQVAAQGKHVLVLIWDNASQAGWANTSKPGYVSTIKRCGKRAQTGKTGVRIIPCWLPTKSPWLNGTLAEVGPRQASDCWACAAV